MVGASSGRRGFPYASRASGCASQIWNMRYPRAATSVPDEVRKVRGLRHAAQRELSNGVPQKCQVVLKGAFIECSGIVVAPATANERTHSPLARRLRGETHEHTRAANG